MVGVWGFGAGVIFLGPQRELKRNPNDGLFESVLNVCVMLTYFAIF